MATHGKKYQEAVKLVDKTKAYGLSEAMEMAKKTSYAKFDETVELHFRMNLDQRAADQQIRGIALLPHGLGQEDSRLSLCQG
jgi:large subunit ribosomal protein L1